VGQDSDPDVPDVRIGILTHVLKGLLTRRKGNAVRSLAEQMEVIRRGAEQIVPEDELVKKLERSV
jgi:hypothetical protein